MKHDKLDTFILNKTSGRFVTLVTKYADDTERVFCAKIVATTPETLLFFDVNKKKNVRVSKKNVTEIRCGKMELHRI